MKKIITTTLIAFIAISVSAQITIEATNLLNAGDLIMQSYDSVAQDPGASGGSQTWDLTGMNSNDMDTILFSSPTGFPGFSLFPDANIGLEDDSTWIFIKKTATEFTFLGSYDIYNGQSDTSLLNWTWLNFPATLGGITQGTLFSDSQADSLGILGVDSFRFTSQTAYKAEIDGWGVVKTPAGNWDALRQKIDYNSSFYVDAKIAGIWAPMSAGLLVAFGIDTGVVSKTTSYRYWGNDANAKFIVATVDTGDGFDGNNYLNATPSGPPTGIYMNNEIPVEVSAYPNPVVRNLNIDLGTSSGKAILRNILGQTAAEKIIYRGNNLLDVSKVNSGTYLLEIQNENGKVIKTEKIEVNK
jgi:hypothetical protein